MVVGVGRSASVDMRLVVDPAAQKCYASVLVPWEEKEGTARGVRRLNL
jgi:hypothetical protein